MTGQDGLSPSFVETVAGFTAGIASTLCLHPLDLVKTRLQGRYWQCNMRRERWLTFRPPLSQLIDHHLRELAVRFELSVTSPDVRVASLRFIGD